MATYISSDGTKKVIEEMHTDNIINALAKKNRELFYAKNQEEHDEIQETINALQKELEKRQDKQLSEKIEKGWE